MHIHPRLKPYFDIADELIEFAVQARKRAAAAHHKRNRQRRGGTIRPGADTPLWNELAAEARRLITRRGQKVGLARYLGLPRQRVHQFLMEKSAGPDAERTLLLLVWVSAKRRRRTLC